MIAQHAPILKRLEEICIETTGGVHAEGNVFCLHGDIQHRLPEMIPKQANLYSLGMHANRVMEVGFNAGHSTLLFLLANPTSKVVAFDIGQHPYTVKCFEYLKMVFGEERLELIIGDSTVTVPRYKQDHPEACFDLYHLDGNHLLEYARKDLENGYDIADVIVVDDTELWTLNDLVDEYIAQGNVDEIKLLEPCTSYQHRILKKRT